MDSLVAENHEKGETCSVYRSNSSWKRWATSPWCSKTIDDSTNVFLYQNVRKFNQKWTVWAPWAYDSEYTRACDKCWTTYLRTEAFPRKRVHKSRPTPSRITFLALPTGISIWERFLCHFEEKRPKSLRFLARAPDLVPLKSKLG